MCKEVRRVTKLFTLFFVSIVCITIFSGQKDAKAASKPVVTVAKRTTTTATIKISKTGDTGYQVYAATSKHGKYKLLMATLTQSYKITKLKKNKSYYVKVRGYRTKGYRITRGKFSRAVKINAYKKTTKPASTTKVSEDINSYTTEALNLINAERINRGLTELKADADFCKAADIRAQELATVFSHTRIDGSEFQTVLDETECAYAYPIEDIYAGMQTVSEVVAACMQDSVRAENAISASNTKVAVGCYYDVATATYYWTILFSE